MAEPAPTTAITVGQRTDRFTLHIGPLHQRVLGVLAGQDVREPGRFERLDIDVTADLRQRVRARQGRDDQFVAVHELACAATAAQPLRARSMS
ncbi:hypothetical protein [Lentzea jiangxiensis]|uniref:hypothetical protein n=1 Tax=Lentzea jiangxiensis TaxID=641025 RepID=UPI000B7F7393|nr:hypothetical protein [Lentzea jiangxiensis]